MGSAILSRPFSATVNADPELLYTMEGGFEKDEDVILEHDGIHFVNSSVFSPDLQTKAALDTEFRDLVDSVIG